MSPKNKKGKKLTSTIMALAMTVTTTFQMPIISMASEIESSVAVESQIEEGTSEEYLDGLIPLAVREMESVC